MISKPATTTAPSASTGDKPLIWVNGQLLPKSQAAVSVYDHGLLYGDGVFEGIRVYKGKIFKLKQHMDRLYACANKIHLDLEKFVSRDEMVRIQRTCVEANGIQDGYIRLVVTRGVGTLGLNPYLCPEPGVVCIADTISLYKPEMYQKGMRVVLANRPKTPIACLDPRIKSLNYLNNILAKCEAIHLSNKLGITKPEDQLLEVIMLNTEGHVTEGSGDNIFFVKDGVVYTPPSEAGILEGITRRFVMDTLCPACGVKVVEKHFTMAEFLDADEAFLTGSAAEMIAVREVLEHKDLEVTATHTISAGEGPITNALRTKFREIVTSDHVPED
ncbi:MAG: branched-chain amino acid aminotransferase [Planctomycetota bacterium]|nr:MAG: branched-chain amino acid aminotransferase [Planctomycetota bacterium]